MNPERFKIQVRCKRCLRISCFEPKHSYGYRIVIDYEGGTTTIWQSIQSCPGIIGKWKPIEKYLLWVLGKSSLLNIPDEEFD